MRIPIPEILAGQQGATFRLLGVCRQEAHSGGTTWKGRWPSVTADMSSPGESVVIGGLIGLSVNCGVASRARHLLTLTGLIRLTLRALTGCAG